MVLNFKKIKVANPHPQYLLTLVCRPASFNIFYCMTQHQPVCIPSIVIDYDYL